MTDGNFFVRVLRNITYLSVGRKDATRQFLDSNTIIPGILRFMTSNDTVEVVPLQEFNDRFVSDN